MQAQGDVRRPGDDLHDGDRLDELVEKLAHIDARRRLRAPAPPGESLPNIVTADSRYDMARHAFMARAERQLALEREAAAVADELLPPLAASDSSGPDDEPQTTLRALQHQILRHPVAFRAAFAALAAEGRRLAETPEGARWVERLRGSALLPDIRLLLRMVSLSLLDEEDPERLPSAYLDALVRAVTDDDTDDILDRLFGGDPNAGRSD